MKISDARFLVLAAAVILAGCASGSGGIKPLSGKPAAVGAAAVTPAASVRVRFTRILVNADCSASIDHLDIVGTPNKKIGWLVEDNGCDPGNDWHIELVFASDWNNGRDRKVKISADDFRSIRVHANTPVTGADGHDYKVWLVQTNFWGEVRRDAVIDPEVDIEM